MSRQADRNTRDQEADPRPCVELRCEPNDVVKYLILPDQGVHIFRREGQLIILSNFFTKFWLCPEGKHMLTLGQIDIIDREKCTVENSWCFFQAGLYSRIRRRLEVASDVLEPVEVNRMRRRTIPRPPLTWSGKIPMIGKSANSSLTPSETQAKPY